MPHKIRTITIQPVMNGYTVTVGCQQLCFESRTSLLKELERYLEKPKDMEKEYVERYGCDDGTRIAERVPEPDQNLAAPDECNAGRGLGQRR